VRRFTTHIVLKSIGVPAFIALFFVGYFLLANHPLFPVTLMPTTGLDRIIGFQPWALGLYASLWIYVSLPPGLIVERRELLFYGLAALGLSLAGMIVFFFWPTATPQPVIDWARYPLYAFLKHADLTRNACPSLHVAFAVFSGFWIDRMLRRMKTHAVIRVLNVLWGLGIIYSTLATKQHVVLDVLGGAILGGGAAVLHWHFLYRRRRSGVVLEHVKTSE
jgi:membrane-associated phospholipid phosphatase